MMDNRVKRTGSNLAEIIIIILIIAAVNYLGYKFFVRLDITQGRQYTISSATKKVLAGLDDPVNAEFFLSGELPTQLQLMRDEIRDKLQEYVAYGHGKFKLKYTDPGDDEKKQQRATEIGVPQFQVQVIEKDQASTKKVFFGIALKYGDKTEAIPIISDPRSLEYELTTRLLKLTMARKPKIGIFAGPMVFGQQQQGPSYQGIQQILGGSTGLYDVQQINPQSDTQLPPDLDGLIILGAFGMSESMKYSLDQYLLKGGRALIALDPIMQPNQQQGGMAQAYPSLPTIEDQLQTYGVRFTKQLIADPASATVGMRTQMGVLMQRYPLFPQIGPTGLNKEVEAVAKASELTMPWCCPLDEIKATGVKYTWLAKTSEGSFLLSSPFNLMPDQSWDLLSKSSQQKGPFTVAVLLTGKFPTAFPGGPPPYKAPPPARAGEVVPPAPPNFDPKTQLKTGQKEGQLIVMSTAAAMEDQMLQQFQANQVFVANVADMLALGDELLGIRSAPATARPLRQTLTDAQRASIRWVNVLGVPVLVALFGLLLWWLKGKRRLAVQRRYLG